MLTLPDHKSKVGPRRGAGGSRETPRRPNLVAEAGDFPDQWGSRWHSLDDQARRLNAADVNRHRESEPPDFIVGVRPRASRP
jgi:hypothetical protein